MKGELTGLFLWSSPHAMIRALILEVLFRGGRERRGERRWMEEGQMEGQRRG